MPPTLADRLDHILVAIDTFQSGLIDKTFENFTSDLMLRLAIERSLEIICEASRRLPEGVKAQHSEINWQGMVDFGNRLRHAYHRINPEIVWELIERDIPPLKAFADAVIRASGQE
jgi:uncharacterized protein with HEPN domain